MSKNFGWKPNEILWETNLRECINLSAVFTKEEADYIYHKDKFAPFQDQLMNMPTVKNANKKVIKLPR